MTLEERNTKIAENVGLALAIASRSLATFPYLSKSEIESAALYGLVKAVDAFDESRGVKFSTYAWHCIANTIRDESKQHTRQTRTLAMEIPVEPEARGCNRVDDVDELDFALSRIRSNVRCVLLMNHVFGFTYDEISQITGMPRATISVQISRTMKLLKAARTSQGT